MEIKKLRILFAAKFFPFTMAHYILRALQRRDDVEILTCGEFYGQWIPWANGMTISDKYLNQVDIPLPRGTDSPTYSSISPFFPWKPDLVLNIDAGFHFRTKPDVLYAVVATDPHVLGGWYAGVRPLADKFFNMQSSYMQSGDELLPYAFDKDCHYPVTYTHYEERLENIAGRDTTIRTIISDEREYDCSIIGLHYPQRDEWVRRLRANGVSVNYRIGDIYDEYREENNKAWIGLNWSSLQDVTARVFEIMAMRMVPVLNRLPGLDALGFVDGEHYLGFSSMDEAVEKVMWAKSHPDFAKQIANIAYQYVYEHKMDWDNRASQILKTMGF